MRYVFAIFLASTFPGAFAQQSAASRDFFDALTDCGASLGGWKCLELDLTSEASVENDSTKVYEYSWNFGDGNRKQGTKIEHCYERFGTYQVSMDLIDTETNTVIRNELSSTVRLYPEIFPVISSSVGDLPPGFLEFTCTYNDADQFQPDRVYWRIDGAYYEGKTILHTFPVAGVYMVEMGLEIDTDMFGTVAACSHTEVTIKESDVWTTGIANFVKEARAEQGTGPFAASDVLCYVKPLTGDGKNKASLIPLNQLMRQLHLGEGEKYELRLIAGNAFSQKKQLHTAGLIGSDLYRALKDSISAFLDEPLLFLNSVTFETNQVTRPDDVTVLTETADLLLKYDFFVVEIGPYVHAGSRSVKGIETSLRRAELVKQVLVEYGVDPKRVSVASPEFNRSLMNTCGAIPDCDWEDASLNGKVEFKITGTHL